VVDELLVARDVSVTCMHPHVGHRGPVSRCVHELALNGLYRLYHLQHERKNFKKSQFVIIIIYYLSAFIALNLAFFFVSSKRFKFTFPQLPMLERDCAAITVLDFARNLQRYKNKNSQVVTCHQR
jgi:hypothetical protein